MNNYLPFLLNFLKELSSVSGIYVLRTDPSLDSKALFMSWDRGWTDVLNVHNHHGRWMDVETTLCTDGHSISSYIYHHKQYIRESAFGGIIFSEIIIQNSYSLVHIVPRWCSTTITLSSITFKPKNPNHQTIYLARSCLTFLVPLALEEKLFVNFANSNNKKTRWITSLRIFSSISFQE